MDFLRSHLMNLMNATLSVDHFHFWVGATTNLNEPQWAVGFGHFLGLTIFKTKKDQDWLPNEVVMMILTLP